MPTSRLGTRACDRPGDLASSPGRGAGASHALSAWEGLGTAVPLTWSSPRSWPTAIGVTAGDRWCARSPSRSGGNWHGPTRCCSAHRAVGGATPGATDG